MPRFFKAGNIGSKNFFNLKGVMTSPVLIGPGESNCGFRFILGHWFSRIINNALYDAFAKLGILDTKIFSNLKGMMTSPV